MLQGLAIGVFLAFCGIGLAIVAGSGSLDTFKPIVLFGSK